jgi:hypothetical protein
MRNLRPVDTDKYFNDPDMPFYGYPKTEENLQAVRELWADAKVSESSIGEPADLVYGSPGIGGDDHQQLMTMFYDEGYYL